RRGDGLGLKILLHDRLADRLDAPAGVPARPRGSPDRQPHHLPARGRPVRRDRRVHAGIGGRTRRARRAVRPQPRAGAAVAWCAEVLDRTGVALTPGVDFDTANGAHTVRLSFAGDTDGIGEAMDRLGPVLAPAAGPTG